MIDTNTFYYSDLARFNGSSFAETAYYHAGRLAIDTVHGDRLCYEDVPETVFEEFKNSDSPGRFYHNSIRGKYPFYSGDMTFTEPIQTLLSQVDERVAEIDAVVSSPNSDSLAVGLVGAQSDDDDATTSGARTYTVIADFDYLETAVDFLSSVSTEATSVSLHIHNDADE